MHKNMRDEFEYPSFIRLFRFLKKSVEKESSAKYKWRDVDEKTWIANTRTAKETNWKKNNLSREKSSI